MNLKELLQTPIGGKNVYIIGFPAAGKSFIANELYHKNRNTHQIIHTDAYIDRGYEHSLYVMLDSLKDIPCNFILEGVGAYRALRKVYELELDHLRPDLIIDVQVPEWVQNEVYRKERPGKLMKKVKALNSSLTNIFNEWCLTIPDKEKPEIINFLNDWKC